MQVVMLVTAAMVPAPVVAMAQALEIKLVLVDRATAELGEGATDRQLAALIQAWADPVLRARNDKPVSLVELLGVWLRQSEQHLANMDEQGDDISDTGRVYRERLRADIAEFERAE
jgi:hypothetical protein